METTRTFARTAMLRRLAEEHFDVLVIGGGITGAGVALDAATRGLRTALVEADDFASGTSSRSSKLVHGGLRYLQQGDVRLVYEALHERQRLLRNAPHLVEVLPFMIPILTRDGAVSRKLARAFGTALWMYDITGGWRIGRRHRRLRRAEVLARMPTLPAERVSSGYLYFDARVDDARLCLTVARTAVDHDAVVVNGARVHEFLNTDGRVGGAIVEVAEPDGTHRRIEVRATTVVNATGVWSDEVRAMDEGTHPASIRPAKGVHITLPWHLVRNDVAVVVSVPSDHRSLFVVPDGPLPDGTFRHTYVGTTDTDYDGPLDEPACTDDDLAYILDALRATLTTRATPADVIGVWAGLRPLVRASGSGRTADLSRRHRVTTSPAGVVTVTGGKMTTYRAMAEDTIDEVCHLLGQRRRCVTKNLRLHGAPARSSDLDRHDHLATRYGSDAAVVRALATEHAGWGEPLVDGLDYLRAEAIYAVRHEQARGLDDVLARRTRARLFDLEATMRAAPAVAELLAEELGWDASTTAAELAGFLASCERERAAAHLPEAAHT